MRKRSHRKLDVLLFLLLFFTFAYFYQGGFANQNSRFDLTLSLAFEGRYNIDSFHWNTIDKAFSNGHYYMEKAPAASYLALPVVWIFSWFVDTQSLLAKPWIADLLLYLGTILSISFISALSAVFFRRFLQVLNPQRTDAESFGLTVLVYLGTLILPYSTQMMGHMLAGAFLLMGFYLGYAREKYGPAFFLWGMAVISEYPSLIPAAILSFVLLARASNKRHLFLSTIWCIPPAALLLMHNYLSFGDVLSLGYGKLQATQFSTQMNQGFFGINFPVPSRILQLLFGLYRGFFVYAPILVIAAGSFIYDKEHSWVTRGVLISFLGTLLINASYGYWQGGVCFGPRHLVFAIPLIALGLAYTPSTWLRHPAFFILAGLSLLINFTGTATTLYVSEWDTKPLFHSYPKLLADGALSFNPVRFLTPISETAALWKKPEESPWASWNVGELLGLPGWGSLIPLLAWFFFIWTWVRAGFRQKAL